MENNTEDIYNIVYDEFLELIMEFNYYDLEKPCLYYDELLPTYEMEVYLNESWTNETQKDEVEESIFCTPWDIDKHFDAKPKDVNMDGRSFIAINELSCKVFSKFYDIDYNSMIEIVLRFILAKWFFTRVMDIDNKFSEVDQKRFNNSNATELISNWAQLFVYKIIKNRPKLLNVFYEISANLTPQYLPWVIIKSLSLNDMFYDLLSLRRSLKPSLSAWRTIMLKDKFFLKVFRDTRIEVKHKAYFFKNEDAYKLINIWIDKGMISVRRDLLPYLETLTEKIQKTYFADYYVGEFYVVDELKKQ
jgi:hypothetical protein